VINPVRIKNLNQKPYTGGAVVYWMSRDQRVHENWALLAAQEKALQYRVPLVIVFNLVPEFLSAGAKHFHFMLHGLMQVERELTEKNINFHLLFGEPKKSIPGFIADEDIGMLFTDFDPLRLKTQWRQDVAAQLDIPMLVVDTHNIIPVWQASDKQEYAAYTIRPKIHKKLDAFLDAFPALKSHPFGKVERRVDWETVFSRLKLTPELLLPFESGEQAAKNVLHQFIDEKLQSYDEERNNPLKNALSNLSPYLHFGQISAQHVALQVQSAAVEPQYKESFLEELIVRRELSDNFCYYNPNYDTFEAFPNWSRQTLNDHQNDPRDYIYSYDEFENAETHDELWNAAQKQMCITGKMHGYMRMYWAKKILEWTPLPREALDIAIQLNDTYSLDGRDPNGYTGVAWSIGGVHDRAWFQRPIFGKVRFMSENGCRKKFDVDEYIRRVNLL